ncbi:uncharacterized protein LOC135155435 [Lytechinus pictus]|uniref:uncharacterized protein LOC135155435 n=1 Tax=Lytechinus pictus TaxID=7653 RepID=UPI0030B9D80D
MWVYSCRLEWYRSDIILKRRPSSRYSTEQDREKSGRRRRGHKTVPSKLPQTNENIDVIIQELEFEPNLSDGRDIYLKSSAKKRKNSTTKVPSQCLQEDVSNAGSPREHYDDEYNGLSYRTIKYGGGRKRGRETNNENIAMKISKHVPIDTVDNHFTTLPPKILNKILNEVNRKVFPRGRRYLRLIWSENRGNVRSEAMESIRAKNKHETDKATEQGEQHRPQVNIVSGEDEQMEDDEEQGEVIVEGGQDGNGSEEARDAHELEVDDAGRYFCSNGNGIAVGENSDSGKDDEEEPMEVEEQVEVIVDGRHDGYGFVEAHGTQELEVVIADKHYSSNGNERVVNDSGSQGRHVDEDMNNVRVIEVQTTSSQVGVNVDDVYKSGVIEKDGHGVHSNVSDRGGGINESQWI